MRSPLVGLVLKTAFIFASTGTAAAVGISEVEQAFASNGPKYVISRYFDCETGEGYRLVASGEPRAIRFAVRLLKHSDTCVSELLHSSLGEAMIVAPETVLPYVNTDQRLTANDICLTFLSADDPPATLRPIVARARSSLLRVTSPELVPQRNACLEQVESLPANLK